jgi:mRNA interferase RelE/StbE
MRDAVGRPRLVKVEFHPDICKRLQQLPRQVFATVLDTILKLGEEPRPTGVVKLAGSGSDWRVRVGQYRIVYEINDHDQVITVLTVAKRSDAYR